MSIHVIVSFIYLQNMILLLVFLFLFIGFVRGPSPPTPQRTIGDPISQDVRHRRPTNPQASSPSNQQHLDMGGQFPSRHLAAFGDRMTEIYEMYRNVLANQFPNGKPMYPGPGSGQSPASPPQYTGAGMNPGKVPSYNPAQVSSPQVLPQPQLLRIPSNPIPQQTLQQPMGGMPPVPFVLPSIITAPSVHQVPSSSDQSDVFGNLAREAYNNAPSISNAADAINTIGQGVGSLLAHAGQIPQYDPSSANARIVNAEQNLLKD